MTGGEPGGLLRADGFAYRTRVGAVMRGPLVTMAPADSLEAAARRMSELDISAVVVADPQPRGIVTERDLLRRVGTGGAGELARPLSEVMTAPLVTIRCDALVASALGRMDRLGIRHLVVIDAGGDAVGMVSARSLLRLRARDALVIGDGIAAAASAAELAAVRAALPRLVAALRRDGVPAMDVAAAIATTVREATARAAELALAAMAAAWGPPPAAWCLLVLGSAGRGESLLIPDQDNALIHAGDTGTDPWFAEFGRRIADLLDQAGIPYCTGGVMAREPRWRRDPGGWRRTVDGWIAAKDGAAILDVDIFFDFHPVAGDGRLAEALRADAVAAAAAAPLFLRLLALHIASLRPPVGLFGRLVATDGVVDLKKGGSMPIVAAARTLALASGAVAVATPDRLAAAVAAGRLADADRAMLLRALETVFGILLDQQVAALADGRAPANAIEPGRVTADDRRALRAALGDLRGLPEMVEAGLSR